MKLYECLLDRIEPITELTTANYHSWINHMAMYHSQTSMTVRSMNEYHIKHILKLLVDKYGYSDFRAISDIVLMQSTLIIVVVGGKSVITEDMIQLILSEYKYDITKVKVVDDKVRFWVTNKNRTIWNKMKEALCQLLSILRKN